MHPVKKMLQKTYNIRFEKVIYGGDAIGRLPDGRIVMAPGLLPGEAARIRITGEHSDRVRAEVAEIIESSPHRTPPGCPWSFRCPGCRYDHCTAEAETAMKRRQLREFLKHLPADAVAGDALRPSPPPAAIRGYRNKIEMLTERSGGLPRLGYSLPGGDILDIPECRLADAAINGRLKELRRDPGFMATLHHRMRLTLRSDADGAVHIRRGGASEAREVLRQRLPDGKDFLVPDNGFFQVNNGGLALLWEEVTEVLRSTACAAEGGFFVDAYAGSGLFSCCAAACGVKNIVAVESNPDSVESAKRNFALRGRDDIAIRAGDAGDFIAGPGSELSEKATVLIDPPRRGLAPETARGLASGNAGRIIYVSCDPATMVRDLGEMIRGGFRVVRARALPMFPRCAAFESVILLERNHEQ